VDVVSAKPALGTEEAQTEVVPQQAGRSTFTLRVVNLLRSAFNNSNAKTRRKN
jgi:hypothetical protein